MRLEIGKPGTGMAKGMSWRDSQAAGRRLDPRGWKTIMESRLGKPVQWSTWNGQGLMMKYFISVKQRSSGLKTSLGKESGSYSQDTTYSGVRGRKLEEIAVT